MQSLNDDKELVNQLQEYIKKLGEWYYGYKSRRY
jgi:hypothetical protein